VPVTVPRSAEASKVSVIRGRLGSGSAYLAGHDPVGDGRAVPGPAVAGLDGDGFDPAGDPEQELANRPASSTAAVREVRRIAVTVSGANDRPNRLDRADTRP